MVVWSAASVASCGVLASVQEATGGVALGSPESNTSMVFLAPTEAGPIVFDLGWTGAEEALARGLRDRGWQPSDVAGVFLTHAHRDHISAWRVVEEAPFYLGRDELPLFMGQELPPGTLDRLAARVWPTDRPNPGSLDVRPFDADTAIAFGADTVRAFVVPGHTRGSAAYLFRGVLFIGDAAGASGLTGLGPPTAIYSHDAELGAANLRGLLERVEPLDARYVCTAHARCLAYADAMERL